MPRTRDAFETDTEISNVIRYPSIALVVPCFVVEQGGCRRRVAWCLRWDDMEIVEHFRPAGQGLLNRQSAVSLYKRTRHLQ